MSEQIRSAMNDTHCSDEKWERIFPKKKQKREEPDVTITSIDIIQRTINYEKMGKPNER